MKFTHNRFYRPESRAPLSPSLVVSSEFKSLVTTSALVVMLALDASAVTRTWNGGNVGRTTNWTGGGGANTAANNWVGGTAPAAGDDLVFAGTTGLTSVNNFAANTSFLGITFSSGAGAFNLSGAAITLTAGITNSSTSIQTLSMPLILSATRTFDAAAGNLAVSGVVSGVGGLTKAGTSDLTLSGTNTYTGITTISSGILSVATIGNGGVAGNLGQATNAEGNIVIGGGSLRYTGVTSSTNRSFTLTAASTGTIDVSTGASVLTISGASAATTGALTKAGAGTLVLSGANAHTGATTINAGTLQIGAAGTTGSLSASSAITNNSALSFNRTNAITQGTDFGTISGTGTLTQAGSGTLIIGSANSYTGTTTISAGTLQIGNGGTTGALSASSAITNNSALSFNRTNTITQGTDFGTISGTGSLTQAGSGTLVLGSTNTYTGVTSITGGTLSVATIGNGGVAGNLGQATNAAGNIVIGGGTLLYTGATASTNRSFTLTAASTGTLDISANTLTISGGSAATTGALTKAGAGTLVLSGANAHTGATTINAGTLQIGAAGTTGSLSASSAITNNSALSFNRTNTITQGTDFGTISGTGTLTQAGSGTLIVNSANSYTGGTTISAGTLQIGNGGTTGALSASSAITNNSAISFNRTNTITQGTDFGTISGTGSLTQAGSGTLSIGSANSYTGSTSINSGILRLTHANGLGTTAAGTTVATGAALELSGDITIGAESLSLAGTGIASGGALRNISGNNAYGGAIAAAAGTSITSDAGILTLNGVVTSSSNVTFGGAGSHVAAAGITGGGNIIKSGTGTLTLATGNGQANTTVNGGQLNVNHLAALGTSAGTLTMAAGTTLDNTSGAAVTVANPKSISLGSSLNFIGSSDLDLGEGDVTLSGNTSINVAANQLTFSGDITGNNFGITKTGNGTLRLDGLSGVNSFTGNSSVNAGTLVIGGTSTLGGNQNTTLTVADGAFLQIEGSASSGNVTILSRPDGLILSSLIDANQKITSSGTLNTNNSKFNGVTTVGAGVTVTASANNLGAIPATPTSGRIVFESGSTLNVTTGFSINPNQGIAVQSGAANFEVSAGQALIVESVVEGTGGVVKSGAGNLRLTGTNTYTGGTIVSAGILGISNGDALGAVSSALKIDGGTVVGAQVVSGAPITAVTIAAERSVVLANGKTSGMDAQTGLSLRYDGVIGQENGAGAAAGLRIGSSAARTGTVILGGNNTFTGATTINFGTLSVSNIGNGGVASNLGASSNAAANLVLGGGTLQYNGASASTDRSFTLTTNTSSGIDVPTSDTTLTLSGGSAATSGALTKTGAGTLRLTGANAHTGATTVAAGRLIVNGSTSAASAVGVSSGATLAGSGTVGGNATISNGGVLAPGNSPGVLTVSGTTTFDSGSVFEWELDTAQSNPETNRGVAYDGVNTGALAGTGAIFKIILTGTQDFSDTFWLQTRTWTDIFKSADGSTTLTDWASVFSGGFQYSYNGNSVAPTSAGSFSVSGNTLTWSAVPEPTNALVGLLAASALLRRRREAWI